MKVYRRGTVNSEHLRLAVEHYKTISQQWTPPTVDCDNALMVYNRAVFDEGRSGGFDPPQEVAAPPESSAEPLWGVDSNPPKNPRFHFLAKPVYLCTTIRRLLLYRDRRGLI